MKSAARKIMLIIGPGLLAGAAMYFLLLPDPLDQCRARLVDAGRIDLARQLAAQGASGREPDVVCLYRFGQVVGVTVDGKALG